jgi:hypothetical protein
MPACLDISILCSDEGADILILARSDARQAESLQEALWRAAAFADAGADMLFIDALASKEEMLAFTHLGGAAAGLPKVCGVMFERCLAVAEQWIQSVAGSCAHNACYYHYWHFVGAYVKLVQWPTNRRWMA